MRYGVRLTILAGALLALVVLASCGGKRGSVTPQPPASTSAAIDLPATHAELDALAPPDGVDAELWQKLKDKLATELSRRASGKLVSDADTFTDFRIHPSYFDPNPKYAGLRHAVIQWSSSLFPADMNGDGAVTISDLTPLAVHFGEDTEAHPEASAADANRDGVVNIADITVLAQSWGVYLDGFAWSWEPKYPLSEAGKIDATGTFDSRGFAVYELPLEIEWLDPHQIESITVRVSAYGIDHRHVQTASDTALVYTPVSDDLMIVDLEVDLISDWPGVRLTWTNSFFRGDANGDGQLSTLDLSPIGVYQGDSIDETPECAIADIDRDGYVTLDDRDEFMRLADEFFRVAITGFQIEISSDDINYSILDPSAYTVEETTSHYGFKQYVARIQELPEMEDIFVRVRPLGAGWLDESNVLPTPAFRIRGWEPYDNSVSDLKLDATPAPPAIGITWSTSFFRGDGNQDGHVNYYDLLPLYAYFNGSEKEAYVADYNGDGVVSISDLSPLAMSLSGFCRWKHLPGFFVELSSLSAEEGFERIAMTAYFDSETDPPRNEYGFRWYRYVIENPPEPPFWVRVVHFDPDGDEGEPSEPLLVVD